MSRTKASTKVVVDLERAWPAQTQPAALLFGAHRNSVVHECLLLPIVVHCWQCLGALGVPAVCTQTPRSTGWRDGRGGRGDHHPHTWIAASPCCLGRSAPRRHLQATVSGVLGAGLMLTVHLDRWAAAICSCPPSQLGTLAWYGQRRHRHAVCLDHPPVTSLCAPHTCCACLLDSPVLLGLVLALQHMLPPRQPWQHGRRFRAWQRVQELWISCVVSLSSSCYKAGRCCGAGEQVSGQREFRFGTVTQAGPGEAQKSIGCAHRCITTCNGVRLEPYSVTRHSKLHTTCWAFTLLRIINHLQHQASTTAY